MENPFVDDIFAAGRSCEWGGALVLQPEALAALRGTLGELGSGVMGRSLVVSAPRAGFGMTHLLAWFASGVGERAAVVPLVFDRESPPRWGGVLEQVGRNLHRARGPRPGLTRLDESVRFLLALGSRRLIADGLIPCSHPLEVMSALECNFLEMFDFGDGEKVVARWFSERFETLVGPMAAVLGPEAGVEPEATARWLRVLLAYAQGVMEPPGRRWEAWDWAVHTGAGAALGGGGGIIQDSASPEEAAKDTVRDLGRLLSRHRPFVFVIDHLDAFYGEETAGLRMAYLVSELRRLLPRSLSLVCVNEDLWQATFRDRLPSALEDRMVGGRIGLRGLTRDQAAALVEARLEAAGVEAGRRDVFRAQLALDAFLAGHDGRPVSPRAVLRHAAGCWASGECGAEASAVSTAPAVPPPVPEAPGHGPGPSEVLPSVVGEKTLDSISAAVQAMVAVNPSAGGGTSSGSPRGSFQQLREKMNRLRPFPATAVASAGTSAPSSGRAAKSPEGGVDLAAVFAECRRRRFEAPEPPAFDLERLERLLRFAGDHFPAMRGAVLAVPGTRGRALQWLAPDAEILIGLESPKRSIFWGALAAHAAARRKVNGGLPVKVVAFAEEDTDWHPAAAGSEPRDFACDVVVVTPADRRQLAAAGDLLEAVETGEAASGDQGPGILLAQALNPFWRRLTRLAKAVAA